MTTSASAAWLVKHASKALLGYMLDSWLGQHVSDSGPVLVPNVWDVWWACYRADRPLRQTGVQVETSPAACRNCAGLAIKLAAANPPRHPGSESFSCDCLLQWARAVRDPGPTPGWPPSSLSFAIIKPGAPIDRIQELISDWFEVLRSEEFPLTTYDLRRLYPEAYGADYVAERDAYMTSSPVRVLTLLARNPRANTKAIKDSIRQRIGAETLRNHLHMPDNPAESLADIAQFSGYAELAGMYRRYERDHAPARLAFYRSALGIRTPGSDRSSGLPSSW